MLFRRSVSVRRARHEYEKAYLARILAEVQAENARREAELNAPCKWCLDGHAECEVEA